MNYEGQGHRVAFLVIPGPTTINDAWVTDMNGARLTSIPPGAQFQVNVSVSAHNSSGGIVNLWSICVTVIDVNDNSIYNWASIDSSGSLTKSTIQESNLILNHLGELVMPNHDLNLRIKVWGADGLTPSPPAPPVNLF